MSLLKIELPVSELMQQQAINARFISVDSADGPFEIELPDKTIFWATDGDYFDLGEDYSGGYTMRLMNKSGAINNIVLRVSPINHLTRKAVVIAGTVDVSVTNWPTVQGVEIVAPNPVPVTMSGGGVQDVNIVSPDPLPVELSSNPRTLVAGSVTIPASGTIALSFAGSFGFGISPAQGASWGGFDLSQGLSVFNVSAALAGASSDLTGVAGTVVGFVRFD